jgi:hypothetical protein
VSPPGRRVATPARSTAAIGAGAAEGPGLGAACLLGLAAAGLFVAAGAVRLAAQGPYYDELHQAAPAFAYVGQRPEMFARVAIGGLPVLNMSYSGALKTALYGAFLAASGHSFRLVEWRGLGIGLAALGFLAFAVLARRGLSTVPLGACLLLLLTDATVILATRHDWGPSALGLLFRSTFLGVWVAGMGRGAPTPASTAVLGLVTGLAAFEKLPSLLLLVPLALAGLGDPRRRTAAHWRAAAVGAGVGLLPLLAVNVGTLVAEGEAVSLSEAAAPATLTVGGLGRHLLEYLALARGRYVRAFVLGEPVAWSSAALEAAAAGIVVAAAAGAAARHARRDPALRGAALAVAAYAGIGVAAFVLPRPPWKSGLGPHHLLLGTPFQYAAVALALTGLGRLGGERGPRWARHGLWAAVAVWLLLRAPGLVSVERSLARGAAGLRWDPSITRAGEFAGRHARDAVFVATDWGVATQLYCFADGRPGLVHEAFRRRENGLAAILDRAAGRAVYLVALRPPSGVARDAGWVATAMAAAPGWVEVGVEPEITGLRAVGFRKFVRGGRSRAPGAGGG